MRRSRRTANARRILEHYDIPDAEPFCFGCEEPAPSWRDLERAHLVDHARFGLDGPQNLVMLCRRCHIWMPSFGCGDDARAWLLNRRRYTRPAKGYTPTVSRRIEIPVGLAEIADRLGVKRQTVAVWKVRGLLPEPAAQLAMGPLWDWPTIAAWAERTGRAKGAPDRSQRRPK